MIFFSLLICRLFGCGITDRGVEKICELIRTNRLEAIQ